MTKNLLLMGSENLLPFSKSLSNIFHKGWQTRRKGAKKRNACVIQAHFELAFNVLFSHFLRSFGRYERGFKQPVKFQPKNIYSYHFLASMVRSLILCTLTMLTGLSLPSANALEINLPAETATYRASPLAGYALVQQNCMICHSAEYMLTQPPTSTRNYWEATIKKMKVTFGAPLNEADIPVIVDYLVATQREKRAKGTVSVP